MLQVARRLKWLPVALAFLAAGCLEREEKIVVHADGAVDVTHVLTGEQDEFDPSIGDALPSAPLFEVEEQEVPRNEGEGHYRVRRARHVFARAQDIPVTFGDPADPAPLRARTTLAIEERGGDIVRWTFERRYAPRANAWRERLQRAAFDDGLRGALLDQERKGQQVPRDVLVRASEAALQLERECAQVHLEDALEAATDGRATVAEILSARAAFARAFDDRWQPEALLQLRESGPGEKARFRTRFRAENARAAARVGEKALRSESPDLELERRIRAEFLTARRVTDVTERLLDDSFEIRIELPAPIILSNAQRARGNVAVFRFLGRDLCDRSHVLRVVAEGKRPARSASR